MSRDYSLNKVRKTLPSLYKGSSNDKGCSNDKSFQKFLYSQKFNKTPKVYPQRLDDIKAYNFISQFHSINSPSVIFSLSDCIKNQQGIKFQQQAKKQFSESNLLKNKSAKMQQLKAYQTSTYFSPKSLIKSPSNFNKQSKKNKQNKANKQNNENKQNRINKQNGILNNSFYQKKNINFQRVQLLNLARWIDQKLEIFNQQKTISINDILQYKQHILNFGLGKVIDSVTKKCKEQGQLLQILWNNSFKIFQKLLTIVTDSIYVKENDFINQQKQTKLIYQQSLQFVKDQNAKMGHQLGGIYTKMKQVILWNKKLRREKKQFSILNRILQYRNQTYTQALQSTIQMFLKAVPQPTTILFSKKIISKLARQKRRKKKPHFLVNVQRDMVMDAKVFVNTWLRRNGLQLQDEQHDPTLHLTNQQRLILSSLDDDNKTNQVDIYNYFKLLDIGIQATQQTTNQLSQYQYDTSHKFHSRGIMTESNFKRNIQIQVNPHDLPTNDIQQKAPINNVKRQSANSKSSQRKSLASRFSQKDKIKQKANQLKKQKQGKKGKLSKNTQKSSKTNENKNKKSDEQQGSELDNNQKQLATINQKNITIISQKITQDMIYQTDQQMRQSASDNFNASIQYYQNNQLRTTHYKQQANEKEGRQFSVKDFTEFDSNQGNNDLRKLWKNYREGLNGFDNNPGSGSSMNYIKYDKQTNQSKKLQKKYFDQYYAETKGETANQNERDDLFNNVMRKRSFYKNKKNKTVFANSTEVQQNRRRVNSLYKGYFNPQSNKNSGVVQLQQQYQQRVCQLSKGMTIPSNLAKSKTLSNLKQTFKLLSQSCKSTKKQAPKNKQYVNASLVSLNKYVSALVMDYMRQIRRQREQIQNDCQKTYYPLYTMLMDKMNRKYGLKDIAQKKIKDFIQKILTFSTKSQKISLYSLLFGMEQEGVGADQLLIYLKCLVYMDRRGVGSTAGKETAERILTDPEVVRENLESLLKQFFDKDGVEIAKDQVNKYIDINTKIVSLEKVADIIIRCLLKRKQLYKKQCNIIYQICLRSNNIYTNLYKMLKVYNDYNMIQQRMNEKKRNIVRKSLLKKKQLINISSTLKQFIKRSDIIDQIYGKSITFDRFLTAYMITDFPSLQKLQNTFKSLISTLNIKYKQLQSRKVINLIMVKDDLLEYCTENVKFLEDLNKKWQVKTIQKPDQDDYKWNIARSVAEHIQYNVKGQLGILAIFNNQIQNFYYSNQQKVVHIQKQIP